MQGFSVIKERILFEIFKKKLVDDNGELDHFAEWVKLFDALGIHGILFDLHAPKIVLVNSTFAEIIGLSGNIVSVEEQYAGYMAFDPASAMNFSVVHEAHLGGRSDDQVGHYTVLGTDGSAVEYNSFSFVIPPAEGEPQRYTIHLLCAPHRMKLVRAYSVFDFFHLTARQQEVLHLLLNGYNKHSISEELGISIRTAEKHIATIIDLAEVESPIALINLVVS
ncbi:helix-turn-helix transcriptional regulator [Rubritalea spongiae]|uniref:Helix-turn-helix transcriptional regulator n=1 Tax=Rubritalea spongiae TaxID=430797 RepID=A0ABW5DYL6_9BACT